MRLLLFIVLAPVCLFAGTKGGGNPERIDQVALKLMIEGDDLRNSLTSYLESVKVEGIEDSNLKSTFTTLLEDNAIVHDVRVSGYYTGPCKDAYNNNVAASTEIGVRGNAICFDTEKLEENFKLLSADDARIKLTSLALHEHVHHFQTDSSELIASNESQADLLAGYLQLTAKYANVPVLKWDGGVPKVYYKWEEAGLFYQGWMWSHCNKYNINGNFYVETVNGKSCDMQDSYYYQWEWFPRGQIWCWKMSSRTRAHVEVVNGKNCD